MEPRLRLPVLAEWLSLSLFFAAFVAIQILIGGTRLIFSLPTYVTLGVAGVILLFSVRETKPTPCRVCLAVTALVFGYLLARIWFSPMPYIARSDLYSALATVVVYLAFALVLTGNNARMFFLAGLLVLALGDVLIGAVQFREGNNFMLISWLQRYDYGARASGFYVCPNHLAGLLEVLGIFGISIVCWSRWPVWLKLLIGYLVLCAYVGLVLTGSRGGYVSTATSLIVFAILSLIVLRRTTPKLFWKVTGLGAIAAVVLGVVAGGLVGRSQFLTHRAQNMADTGDIRRYLWDAALRQWKVAPIYGTGSATYLYYGRYFRSAGMQRDPVYVHNDYLHLLAEYGLVGIAGMGLLLAAHLRRGARSFLRLGPKRVAVSEVLFSNGLALNIGAISAVAAFAVHEVVDFNLHIPANALLLAFVFALIANDGVERDRNLARPLVTDQAWRLGLGGIAFVLASMSARLLPGEYFSEKARVAVRENQPAVAILEATRGVQYDPANPDLHFRLGMARNQLAESMTDPLAAESFYTDAIEAFTRARVLAPQEVTYALELAETLDMAGRFPEAEWIYGETLELDPKSESLKSYYDRHVALWAEQGAKPKVEPPAPTEAKF